MPLDELKFTDDAYYRKGNYSVLFTVAPKRGEADPKARRRALNQMLLAIREETGLKVSSFVDIDPTPISDPEKEALEDNEFVDEDIPEKVPGEFLIFNKLGVTNINKIRRFMDEHLVGESSPKLTVVDPQTNQHYVVRDFTIQYLFHYFVAGAKRNNWEDLRDYLKAEDKGYKELAGKAMKTQQKEARYIMPKLVIFRGAVYIEAAKPDLIQEAEFAKYLASIKENVISADREIEATMNQVPRVADLIRKLAGQFGDRWVDELEPWRRYTEAYGEMGERVQALAEKLQQPYTFIRRVGDAMDMLTRDKRYQPDDKEATLIDEIAQLTGGTLVTL
jgi:hypothetical protein